MTGTTHFTSNELMCKCGCEQERMNPDFMARLEALRVEFDKPMRLSSAYRCPQHDADIGGAGVHPTGQAVDVIVAGNDAHRILELAMALGFTGIGISQKGDFGNRFIHLDNTTGPTRPWVWSY